MADNGEGLRGKTAGQLPYLVFRLAVNQPDCHRDQWPDTNSTTSHGRVPVRLMVQPH